jgi:hypothetical protein
MLWGGHRLAIPSNTEYSVEQLRFMLREVEGLIGREVTADEWRRLRRGQGEESPSDGAPDA